MKIVLVFFFFNIGFTIFPADNIITDYPKLEPTMDW